MTGSKEAIARIAVLSRGGGTPSQATATIRVPTATSARGPGGSRVDIVGGGTKSDAGILGHAVGSAGEAPRTGATANDAPLQNTGQRGIDLARFRSTGIFALVFGALLTILVAVGLRLRAMRLGAGETMGLDSAAFPDIFDTFSGLRESEASDDSLGTAAWDRFSPP